MNTWNSIGVLKQVAFFLVTLMPPSITINTLEPTEYWNNFIPIIYTYVTTDCNLILGLSDLQTQSKPTKETNWVKIL